MSELPDMLPEDDDVLAADYALGALDGAAMRDAELRARRDPAFARAVEGWQALLAPLAETVPPVAPPAAVWAKIAGAIDPTPRVAEAVRPRSLWSNVAFWRALTAGATTCAVVAVALLVTRPPERVEVRVPVAVAAVPGTLLTAQMAATDKSAAVLINATFDPSRGAVILTPAAKDASAGKTPELWVIVGKNPPRSLGLIDLKGAQEHRIPADLRPLLGQGATLAISLEPAGGSPTGAPTGPVVAAGKLAAI